MRYAVIDSEGRVVNVVRAGEGWTPPAGHEAVEHAQAGPGWTREGDTLVAPEPDEPDQDDEEPGRDRLADLEDAVDTLILDALFR